jgi:eukaryotic-like serine/threonine-protein kinase
VSSRDPRFTELEPEVFPRVFGNYLLLHHLARGGMGEVYLAKTGGLAGIEKHSVVKTLRPHFTSDREYVARFIDEARVVVGLGHRNIAQTFDVGRVGAQYYLAMEYIPGTDLRSIQERSNERKGTGALGEALVLHTACEVLEALDYAHRAKSPVTGKPLQLVHRDISPQNVMVNFEGEVKLIDFGLAQSTQKEERTQPNMVMGKMAYMSPEQARGEGIDASADQFAAAIIVYELLTGERYYGGMGTEQIWAVAGRGDWQAARFGQLHPDLQRVLKRSLDPDSTKRFPSCGDLREELISYQYAQGMRSGSRELRGLMEDLFAFENQQHEDLISRFAGIQMPAGSEGVPFVTPSGKNVVVPAQREETISFVPSQPVLISALSSSAEGPALPGESTAETTRVPPAPRADKKDRTVLWAAGGSGGIALLVVLVAIAAALGRERPAIHEELLVTPVLVGPVALSEPNFEPPPEPPPEPVAQPAGIRVGDGKIKSAPVEEAPIRRSVAKRAPPAPRRSTLPDEALRAKPERLIDKMGYLKRWCTQRVACARTLTNTRQLDLDQLERLHKQGEFDACIKTCKQP